MSTPLIAELAMNTMSDFFAVISDISFKTANNGSPFLTAKLTDMSGTVDAKMWDFPGGITADDAGRVIKIRGRMEEYRGTKQVIIQQFRFPASEEEYDVGRLVPVAPIDVDAAKETLLRLVNSIEDRDYRCVCLKLFEDHADEWLNIPAAANIHHAFLHGLLMHTVDMLETADFLGKKYARAINRDLLLAGTFLHDIGKMREFAVSELGIVRDYTDEGHLLGHLYMGAQEVAAYAAAFDMPATKAMLLQHLLLSHHGKPDFGAAVIPQTPEAILLSEIDMLDSRMEICTELLDKTETLGFTEKSYALDCRLYNHRESC